MPKSHSEENDRLPRRRQRTIAALTDLQLRHKRDLDRKAQRALRQRTKSRIEDLEQEVEQLKLASTAQESKLTERIQILQDQNRILSLRLEQIGRLAVFTNLHASSKSPNGIQIDGSGESPNTSDCIIGILLVAGLGKQMRLTIVVDIAPNIESPTLSTTHGIHGQGGRESSKPAESNVPASRHESRTYPRGSAFAIDSESDAHNSSQHHGEFRARINASLGPRLTPETSEQMANTDPALPQTPANDTDALANPGKEPGWYQDLFYSIFLESNCSQITI